MTPRHHINQLRVHWRDWFRTRRDDAEYQQKIIGEFVEQMEESAEDNEAYEEMVDTFKQTVRRMVEVSKSACPIAFFKPSWEQAQVLNAWHPEFDPDAPEGYRTVCNFTTNRGGKTTASVIDTLLWLIPNDPDWVMFEWHEDEEGKKHGNDRGRYRVELRPDWDTWRRTGRMVYNGKDAPPKSACEVWHGVENDEAWKDKVLKEYLKWLPRQFIGVRSDGGTAIFVQERRIDLKGGSTITGKTFNADSQAWAGKAVWRIVMDEGFEKRIFDEATLRVQGGGYFHWAYTVAEARNTGQRAKLAHDCYKGKHKLVGKAKFFTGFRMDMIPDWIMAADKKADDIARLSQEGEMGRVRMGEIPFFESSPLVFLNFERNRNILPIDGADVLLAIKGQTVSRWVADFGHQRAERLQMLFHRANIIRGLDEGMAAPTACVWQAILKTNEYVAFRCWEEANLSVGQRCEKVIDLSGNTRELLRWNEDETRRVYRENMTGMKVRRTFGDSKMFKRNQELPSDDWTATYSKNGLKLERATNIGPAARCDTLNDLLRADPTRKHLLNQSDAGCAYYVTRDCLKLIERFENYLFEQFASGQRAGEYTGQPERKDDHVLDGATFCSGAKLRWADPETKGQESLRIDPSSGCIVR